MLVYVLGRIAAALPALFGVSLVVFFMLRLVPGDPVDMMFVSRPRPTAEQRQAVERDMGLDLPIHRQYVKYVGDLLQGDLGDSFRSKRPVLDEIVTRLPNTLRLTTASLVIALTLGIGAGVMAAAFKDRFVDRAITVVTVIGLSVPSFWLALMVILLFAVRLRWFPVAGAGTWRHLVLPAMTLGLLAATSLARLTRASMLEALGQDYVRTAQAKGLRRSLVVWRHALRNALIPIVTIVGLLVGGLLSGAFFIEAVFAYPGIGYLAVTSFQARDFPMIQGIVLFVAVVYVLVNLVTDLLYAVVDPRVVARR